MHTVRYPCRFLPASKNFAWQQIIGSVLYMPVTGKIEYNGQNRQMAHARGDDDEDVWNKIDVWRIIFKSRRRGFRHTTA